MRYLILLVAALAAGCATKHYGRQGVLTDYEKDNLTCREISLEQAKVDGFVQQVKAGGRFNGKTVLGFAGDFGIGNGMEKRAAMRSAKGRAASLDALWLSRKCEAPAISSDRGS